MTLDKVDLPPAQAHQLCDIGDRGGSQPVDDQCLEPRREAATRFGPWNADLTDAMLGAPNSGHIAVNDGLVLTGVQMAPRASAMIIPGGLPATLPVQQCCSERSWMTLTLIWPAAISSSTSATCHGAAMPNMRL